MDTQTSQRRWTIGTTSLALFAGSTFGLALTTLLTFIPRDNELRAVLTWLGLLVGFSYLFVGIPMLVAAFIVGIVSVAKNSGRREGLITISGVVLCIVALLAYLLLKG
jgi:hypothetical protein